MHVIEEHGTSSTLMLLLVECWE